MKENILTEYDGFFFVGIGGVSMSALAKILKELGKRVAGCDRCGGEYVDNLIKSGIDIKISDDCDVGDMPVVVYTDALSESNPTLIRARRRGRKLLSRGELLYELSKNFSSTIAVSGCHGKTTCTSMLAHIFYAAGAEFSAHIGGDDLKFSNGYLGGYDYFVTEACEYKKNFLRLKPRIAVVLNSDADHLECYGTKEELQKAYVTFARGAEKLIKLYGDLDGADGVTFGFDNRADYFARNIKCINGRHSFSLYERGKEYGLVTLSVAGKHNVLNALAAAAAARAVGIGFDDIARGLGGFKGVRRRFESIGAFNGAECIADYAHHPNEIKASIKTAKSLTRGELYVVFQPHTYSRTKNFFAEFVSALSQIRHLMVYKTFAAREYYDDAGSALTLSRGLRRSVYGCCETDIENFLLTAKEGDTILFLGAGDIYDIARGVCSR